MNVLVALICALVILPPILVWAESDGRKWVSSRLIRHDDEPIAAKGSAPIPVPELPIEPLPA